jgi:hypothetical protein
VEDEVEDTHIPLRQARSCGRAARALAEAAQSDRAQLPNWQIAGQAMDGAQEGIRPTQHI